MDFSYKEGECVLCDFSLHVKPGENIALVGETGAGKSTIVNLVCRFYEPTSGRVLIDGRDYRERSQLWLQAGLGYVLQTPHLFSGTIRDNIAYGRKDATEQEIREAAQMVRAEEFILRQERGYDTEVGEGGAPLHGREAADFLRPRDTCQPAHIRARRGDKLRRYRNRAAHPEAITKVLRGRTSFIVAHRLSTIRSADRILVIRGGRITEQGTHRELLKLRGYYYNLYTTQFREEASGAILDEKAIEN